MATSLLETFEHYCFHTPLLKIHKHPDLHQCTEDGCGAAIQTDLAKKAQLHDETTGVVSCPKCGCKTEFRPGRNVAELHVKLCTDPTIHYPEMHKAGKLSKDDFTAWKATLTRDELLGHYKRVPDQHLVVTFSHDETTLLDTDRDAFTALAQTRAKERAEIALLHQVPHRHKTTTGKISL